MAKTSAYLVPTLVVGTALVVAGCSGSSSSRYGGGGGGGEVGNSSPAEGVMVGSAETVEGVEETVTILGEGISQVELPVGDEITSGTGEIVVATAGALGTVSDGLRDGMGNYRENDNYLGTTAGGVTGTVSDAGDAVAATGRTVGALSTLPGVKELDEKTGLVSKLGGAVEEFGFKIAAEGDATLEAGASVKDARIVIDAAGHAAVQAGGAVEGLNTLPVLMQFDEKTGLVTALGGTVEDLGIKIATIGDELTLVVTDEDSPVAKSTTKLGVAIRPVLVKAEDGLGHAGDALVIGPVASDLLDKAAGVVVDSGAKIGAKDPRLAGLESTLGGVGAMVSASGGLLTAGGESGDLPGLGDLRGLVDEPGLPHGGDKLKGKLTGLLDDLRGRVDEPGLPHGGDKLKGKLTGAQDKLTGVLADGEDKLPLDGGDRLGKLTGALEGVTRKLTGGLGK